MLYTIEDDEIDVSHMTLAETQAEAQVMVVFNALEEINIPVEILALEMLYAAGVK